MEGSLLDAQRIVSSWARCSQDLTSLQGTASHRAWEGRCVLISYVKELCEMPACYSGLHVCDTHLVVNMLCGASPSITLCRYEDKFFERLCERLDEVVAMRETHAELLELLGTSSFDHVVSL